MDLQLECSLVKGETLLCYHIHNYANFSRPILIAEISLPHQRGRLISLQQWMITWGVCDGRAGRNGRG
jgi:hypothetical protein